ncbi:longitudinals lacking protein, isoforms N/O/W/X/Y isoform X3 [Hyalella azteca]|uniref:Longitudinals lacking protein, isoforms N/O/W/X/Y isoform X3 n=1 Tax=Hyalella azteca TaxID=294128 RepID=A0A979FNR1_HYAAZ|nr:longitudinals lacking protein, isoforms N/O/W/X/Y isoform X3 [Hyalella azteca]
MTRYVRKDHQKLKRSKMEWSDPSVAEVYENLRRIANLNNTMAEKDEELCVNWSMHQDVLASKVGEFLECKQFHDVSLYCTEDNEMIPAHKLVLSSCSDFFKNLFDRVQETNAVVVVKDVRHKTLQQILRFMYVGTVVVTATDVPEFMKAAKQFKVTGLDVDKNGVAALTSKIEDVQGKELDLSRNRTTGAFPSTTSSDSIITEDTNTITPNFMVPGQPALNPSMINHAHLSPFDSHILNTALAFRTGSQFLSNRLATPSHLAHNANLSRQSHLKSIPVDASKQLQSEKVLRDPAVINRRYSNSPEDSLHSNASLDLTKATSSISPLNRIGAVTNPLNSLASVGQATGSPNINPVSAAVLASQIQHYSQFSPQIRVSQSLLNKRSRSKSPETNDSKLLHNDGTDDDRSPHRFNDHQENSSPRNSEQSGKQNSSAGASEHYSDDESGTETKYNENLGYRAPGNGRARSVSPGPSTSTPKVTESFMQSFIAGYPRMPWNYSTAGDDIKTASDNTGTSEILAALINAKNVAEFNPALLVRQANAFPNIATTFPQLVNLPQTLASFQSSLTNSVLTSHPKSGIALNSQIPTQMMALMAEQERLRLEEKRMTEERIGNKKRRLQSSTSARFECDVCQRSYASHGNLKRHKKYECGQPPTFACPVCDCMFQHRHSMKIHYKGSHKEEYAKYGFSMVDNVSANNTNIQLTKLQCHSPSSSPPLRIVDDVPPYQPNPNVPPYQEPSSLLDIKRESLRTIATAEVSVSSLPQKDLDNQFLAVQRAPPSQSSNTDNV